MKIYKKICVLLVALAIASFSVLAQPQDDKNSGKDNRKPRIPVGEKGNKDEKKPDKKPDKKPNGE